jgi:hypothetical protein
MGSRPIKLQCDLSWTPILCFFAGTQEHRRNGGGNESTYNRPEVKVAVDSPRRDFHRSTAWYVHRYGICTQHRSLSTSIRLSCTTIPTSALLLYKRESELRPMWLWSMWLRAMWLRAMWLRALRRLRPAATCSGDRTPDREARIHRAPVRG